MLNKKLGKIISVTLAVLIIFASLPTFSVFASDIIDSGKCGDNLTWTLDSDGLLTISGTGKMDDFSYSVYSPWNPYRDSIETVEIEYGVTSIGCDAFWFCRRLTSVTIPGSVESIEFCAFSDCTGLTKVTIPDGVTFIGNCAFSGCTELISITIPDSVTLIEEGAFQNTAWFDSQADGLVYAGKVAYEMKGTCPASVTIKDRTVSITGYIFGFSGPKSIRIPDSVTDIGWYAFYGCTELTTVYYTGTEEQRNQIEIGWNGNDYLINANWVYNYVISTIIGDITGDGYIDSSDLALIVNSLIYNEEYNKAYDLNNDGNVNILDLIAMKKQIANI